MLDTPQSQKKSISYEQFAALDLRVAKVVAAEPVPDADKLIRLTLDVGELGERTIVSGIKPWFTPEQLIDKTIIYLANLEPRIMRGVESQGMLLAAGDGSPEQPVVLLTTETTNQLKPGAGIR